MLEREVNPSIAKLGGIEGATAYPRLGGGCQGCGMATATLSQGIEVAIAQTVSEIDRVIDVTNDAPAWQPHRRGPAAREGAVHREERLGHWLHEW